MIRGDGHGLEAVAPCCEKDRLSSGPGQLERARTRDILERVRGALRYGSSRVRRTAPTHRH